MTESHTAEKWNVYLDIHWHISNSNSSVSTILTVSLTRGCLLLKEINRAQRYTSTNDGVDDSSANIIFNSIGSEWNTLFQHFQHFYLVQIIIKHQTISRYKRDWIVNSRRPVYFQTSRLSKNSSLHLTFFHLHKIICESFKLCISY